MEFSINFPNVRVHYNKRNALQEQDFTADRQRELTLFVMATRKPDKLFEVYVDASGYRTAHTGMHYWQSETATKTATAATKTAATKPKAKTTAAPKKEPKTTKAAAIEIVDYSEKAFAIIGDTKPLRTKLKELGARFNPRLTCGAGWIIAKSGRNPESLKRALSI